MIYVGLINFNERNDEFHRLVSVLDVFTQGTAVVIRKEAITLCYGKLSIEQDKDEIWENESAILMGRIFDREQQQRPIEKKYFQTLSYLDKEQVLEKIWGKYVYINKRMSQFEIVIDLTGQLPFFYYPFSDGNILFSSDIEIIFKVLAQKPEYNWAYLYSYVVYGNSSAIQTPFKNVYELPPGCCLKISKNDRKTEIFWDPLCFHKTFVQKGDAVDVLETVLKPWIKPYKNICVSLSGGLDSSSLVYCLKNIKREDQKLVALNYFHASIKSSNELMHARKVCQETDIELIELDVSHTLPFDLPHKRLLLNPNKPCPALVSLRWTESVFDHVPSIGSYVFLSGHGSDHIFMCPPSKKSISDYILEKGFKGFNTQLKDLSQFSRDPFFSILKENTISLIAYFFSRRLKKRNLRNIMYEIPDWIKKNLRRKTSLDFVHPIYEHLSAKVLPGKYEQIDAFYDGLASIQVEPNQVNPTYYPFLYGPMVEFALSFNSHALFDKGYDRYPLRKAVSEHYKTETVWRRDKSQTTGIFQLGIKKNVEYIVELCLEGHFVKQGIIDKDKLRKTIMLIGNGDVKHMWPFMHMASSEIFLRYWEEKAWRK